MHKIKEHNHVINPAIVKAKIALAEIRQRAPNSRDPPLPISTASPSNLNR